MSSTKNSSGVIMERPPKRRGTPIPVLPPRIPTPLPPKNNLEKRVVLGGSEKDPNCPTPIAPDFGAPKTMGNKYLDQDLDVWINPRLLSKIDLKAVTSSSYIKSQTVQNESGSEEKLEWGKRQPPAVPTPRISFISSVGRILPDVKQVTSTQRLRVATNSTFQTKENSRNGTQGARSQETLKSIKNQNFEKNVHNFENDHQSTEKVHQNNPNRTNVISDSFSQKSVTQLLTSSQKSAEKVSQNDPNSTNFKSDIECQKSSLSDLEKSAQSDLHQKSASELPINSNISQKSAQSKKFGYQKSALDQGISSQKSAQSDFGYQKSATALQSSKNFQEYDQITNNYAENIQSVSNLQKSSQSYAKPRVSSVRDLSSKKSSENNHNENLSTDSSLNQQLSTPHLEKSSQGTLNQPKSSQNTIPRAKEILKKSKKCKIDQRDQIIESAKKRIESSVEDWLLKSSEDHNLALGSQKCALNQNSNLNETKSGLITQTEISNENFFKNTELKCLSSQNMQNKNHVLKYQSQIHRQIEGRESVNFTEKILQKSSKVPIRKSETSSIPKSVVQLGPKKVEYFLSTLDMDQNRNLTQKSVKKSASTKKSAESLKNNYFEKLRIEKNFEHSVFQDNQNLAAAAFFARAAQKLNLTSSPHRRKRHSSGDEDYPMGGFSGAIQRTPPPVPPALLRRIGVKEISSVGKVKVMLRVSTPTFSNSPEKESSSNSYFNLDKRKKQVTLYDPGSLNGGGGTPEDRRLAVAAPKMFAFDAIFSQDDSQTEVCSSALTDIIHAVINGSDGCLFCFGHAGLGKSYTMLGSPDSQNTLGVIPCAISWLFRGINEQKLKTGARFSVRVSAVEICGPSNSLKDLLVGHANDSEQSPGMYLRDDPLFGTQLQNQSELRAPSAEKAAYYLDAALQAKDNLKTPENRDSHFLYTLHVYQYVAGKSGVAGGRSRLHLLDLGNPERYKNSNVIPLSGLGNILLGIFNGQKHLPYKDNKLTTVLKECLGNLTCHVSMIVHVSSLEKNYPEILSTLQLASRIHRMRRRKIKFVSSGTGTGSGGSSGEEHSRNCTSSEPDPSSSDFSADTVIYVGPADSGTDGEHPPVYIPSLNSGDNRGVMSKVLKGSSMEQNHKELSKSLLSKNSQDVSLKNSSQKKTIPKSSKTQTNFSPKPSPSKKLEKEKKLPGSSNSDEQWIDGPKISKKYFPKNQIFQENTETWIDGPLKRSEKVSGGSTMEFHGGQIPQRMSDGSSGGQMSHGVQNLSKAGHRGEEGQAYGYMDSHKKSMIKKWVQLQSTQALRKNPKEVPEDLKDPPNIQKIPFKELTTFKEEVVIKPLEKNVKKSEEGVIRTGLKGPKGTFPDLIQECSSPDREEEEIVIPPPLPLIEPLSSRESQISSRDLEECNRNLEEDEEYLEIIEVEEPLEPVPMQDCCLQCNEEDILLSMGIQIENPLPEFDQKKSHPLRILSEENLTVVSTFTDSLSIYQDLEGSRFLPGRFQVENFQGGKFEDKNSNVGNFPGGKFQEFTSLEQLSRMREVYTSKLAQANLQNSSSGKFQKLSRSESLSLTDMLYGNQGVPWDSQSIYSEPAYLQNDPSMDHFCHNCKISLSKSDIHSSEIPKKNCFQKFQHNENFLENDNFLEESFQNFFSKFGKEVSRASLRHPDGSSNPDLLEKRPKDPCQGMDILPNPEEFLETASLNGSRDTSGICKKERRCSGSSKTSNGASREFFLNRASFGTSEKSFRTHKADIGKIGISQKLSGVSKDSDGSSRESNGTSKEISGIKDTFGNSKDDFGKTGTSQESNGFAKDFNETSRSTNETSRDFNEVSKDFSGNKDPLETFKGQSGICRGSSGTPKDYPDTNFSLYENYEDSGNETNSRTSKSSPGTSGLSRRAESGYSSVLRDSESSSIESESISKFSKGHRRVKCKHKNDRSFCSWLLNPFTCKYIEEPPETHF